MKKRLMILDGSSLMFRAFYALPPLTAPGGEYTNAIFGFANMLIRMLADYAPDGMAVAFDKSRHTFRTELYPAYKGTRQATPAEFSSQVPLLAEMLAAWGIPFLEMDDYEADDIIGTLTAKAEAAGGYESLVVTGDRDALQLVSPATKVLFTRKGISDIVLFDEDAFQKKYGFAPIRLIDLKGLMGDASDNIPGVPGVGEKTATKLLLQFGSLEGVMEHLAEVPGKKLQEKLTVHRDQAALSKRLATIVRDAPVDFTPEDYVITPDREKLARFCDKYDLKAVRRGLAKLYPEEELTLDLAAPEVTKLSVERLETAAAAEDFAAAAKAAGRLAFAGRYQGRVPHVTMTGAGLAAGERLAYADAQGPAWPVIWRLLEDGSLRRETFDLKSFYHAGGSPSPAFFDAGLAGYLLDPSLGAGSPERLRGAFAPDAPPLPLPSDPAQRAAAEAGLAARLRDTMEPRLRELGLDRLYAEIELPLVEVLADMERTGIYVDRERLRQQTEAAGHTIASLESDIYALAGHPFKINSPKQLSEVLFVELQLPGGKKTKSGGFSTNVEELERLREDHPIIEKILAYRLWTKLKSTYLDAIDGLIDPETGRVHTSFNQMVTATGRLSSSDPNLQNIPVRTEEGRAIRLLFGPGEGYDGLLSADYSQIELRILAHLSQDENFVGAFNRGEDIHTRTAAEVFGVAPEEVTPLLRRHAKAVNFGIVYGISDYGLSQGLGISRAEAGRYIESYFAKCRGVKAFIDKVVAEAHEKGCVTTMFGRRRDLPAIHSKNFQQRSLAERMAMNTPIQGSAADIIKLAMIRAWRGLREAGLKSRILLQVHDELVLEVTGDEAERAAAVVREAMENVTPLSVPLTVDVHQGANWAEAK